MDHAEPEDRIIDVLHRLSIQLQQHHPRFFSQLQPGLSPDEIAIDPQGFPYHLPQEVMPLYTWRNGMRRNANRAYDLFPSWSFLAYDEALQNYREKIKLNAEAAENGYDPIWSPQWWPLLKFDSTQYLIVEGHTSPQASSPVYQFFIENDGLTLRYDSVQSMLETIAAAYANGAYRVNEEGSVNEDERQEAQLVLQHNPQRTAWWLDKVPGTQSVADLVAVFADEDDDEEASSEARQALEALQDLRTVPALIPVLQNPSSEIRADAADLLGQLGDGRAVEPLIAALRDPETWVREAAAEALAKVGNRRAGPPLIDALRASPPGAREEIIGALGELGDPQAIDPLLQVLQADDPPPDVGRALGMLRARQAPPPLVQALQSPDLIWREMAAEALGRIGDRRGVEPLLDALTDPHPKVRWLAAEALGKLQDARAITPLERLQDDENEVVRRLAREAIDQFLQHQGQPPTD